jgi:hypothetical protein
MTDSTAETQTKGIAMNAKQERTTYAYRHMMEVVQQGNGDAAIDMGGGALCLFRGGGGGGGHK